MINLKAAYRVHNDSVGYIAFFPDGRRVLTATHEEAAEDGLAGVIKVWETSGEVVWSRRDPDYPPYVALSGDGTWVAWGSDRGRLRIFPASGLGSDREVPAGEVNESIEPVTFLPDHRTLVFRNVEHERSWWLWDVTTSWPPERSLGVPTDLPIAVSPDGKYLALGHVYDDSGNFARVHLWDIERQRFAAAFDMNRPGVGNLSFHPTQSLLSACSQDEGEVRVWDYSDLECVKCVFTLPVGPTESNYVLLLRDSLLVTATGEGELSLWDITSHRLVSRASTADLDELKLIEEEEQITITQDKPEISELAVSPDGRTIAAGTYGGAVAFYDVSG